MKGLLCVLTLLTSLFSVAAFAESISDKLIAAVVEKNLPGLLYEHIDKPWQLGTYNLRINKSGVTQFASSQSHLTLRLPIEAIIHGNVRQNLMGRNFSMGCNSRFTTDGRIEVEPQLVQGSYQARVSIVVPIPDTALNCDGMMIPIKTLLEQLVAENKRTWEQDLETDINQLFQQVGI